MRGSTTMTRGNGPGGVGESLRTLFGVGTLSRPDGWPAPGTLLREGGARRRGGVGGGLHGTGGATRADGAGGLPGGAGRPARRRGCLSGGLPGPGAIGRTDPAGGFGGELAYGVARRVALRARRQAARRRELERRRLAGSRPRSRSPRRPRSPGPSSTRSSTGCPSRSAPRSCSATWRATLTSRPPGCSAARSGPSRAGWRGVANGSGVASSAGALVGRRPDRHAPGLTARRPRRPCRRNS